VRVHRRQGVTVYSPETDADVATVEAMHASGALVPDASFSEARAQVGRRVELMFATRALRTAWPPRAGAPRHRPRFTAGQVLGLVRGSTSL